MRMGKRCVKTNWDECILSASTRFLPVCTVGGKLEPAGLGDDFLVLPVAPVTTIGPMLDFFHRTTKTRRRKATLPRQINMKIPRV